MNVETWAAKLLQQAEALAQAVESWVDLSYALFDPFEGIVARTLPSREEREAFVQTAEYRKIRERIKQARQRFGRAAGAPLKQGGRLLVSVPLSLKAALEREARAEGISLDQLVTAKLSAQLSGLVPK